MIRVAVDVGGTFTDLVAFDDETGRLILLKVRSFPTSPERGCLEALVRLIGEGRVDALGIQGIIHTGTIGSNLLLGQLGMRIPRVALITTRGFRDVVEIGRQNRPELYNPFFQRPRPLVPRKLRFEVTERVGPDGRVEQPVVRGELEALADVLRDAGVEALAICFLNSYLNPENEAAAKAILEGELDIPIYCSWEVDPEHREYERTSTTVVAATLAPVLAGYLGALAQGLRGMGVEAPIHVFSSSGGLVDLGEVVKRPIVAIESGPAAGVVGAAELARRLNLARVISLDMGGTSAKAGSIVDFRPLLVPEVEVGGRVHMGRMVKGSGYPVRYPSIDLAEVSAGGGTIIWADEAGALRVGPLSAGAEPGPACYGRGGVEPTVTDANLLLGRLGVSLLDGEVRLAPDLAEEALARVAGRVKMGVVDVAVAALRLVNLQMARAVRLVSLERGLDPREFTLMAFGGAGPMHAVELAEELGITSVVIPPAPGLFTALGLLLADMKFNYVLGLLHPLDELGGGGLDGLFREMELRALRELAGRGLATSGATLSLSLDLRYQGQGYELEIPASRPLDPVALARDFEETHQAVYGYRHEGERIEVTALRLTVTLPVPKPQLRPMDGAGTSLAEAERGERRVYFHGSWVSTPIYRREQLPVGVPVQGPAIVEEYGSTLVLPPGWRCARNAMDCLLLSRLDG